jgi:death-on-curing protein
VIYLTLEHVLAIRDAALEEHGGASGLHSQDLLESAIEMPKSSFGGTDLYPDLFDKAAAYLFFIASNHGFNDGNKRTALAAALTFLSLNGQDFEIPANRWSEAEEFTLAVAQGTWKRDEATKHFKEFLVSIGGKPA